MTKNNRFKQEVRAYQRMFDSSYTEARERVSQAFLITPEMEALVPQVQNLINKTSGMVLITGLVGSGKTFVQHYLIDALVKEKYKVVGFDPEGEFNSLKPYLSADYPPESFGNKAIFIPKSKELDFSVDETYLQILNMRPDLISISELRHKQQGLGVLYTVMNSGRMILSSLHSRTPSHSFESLNFIFEDYIGKLDDQKFIKNNVRMVIDVSRVRVNGKSLPVISNFLVDDELVKAWVEGNLESFLESQGVKSANQKKLEFQGS